MASPPVILPYALRQRFFYFPSHRWSLIALWPLLFALVPVAGYFMATPTRELTLGNAMLLFGSLFSPINLLLSACLAFLFRREWIGFTLCTFAGTVALANTALLLWVLRDGIPC
jgi:hypothetical protein